MPALFERARIGSLELPNRFVRSATAEGMCGPEGEVSPEVIEIYRTLAAGGVGLIITGHCYVAPNGKANDGMMGLWKDDLVPGLAALCEAVHDAGGKVAAQVNHAGRQTTPKVTGHELVAPSAIAVKGAEHTPRELAEREIADLTDAYAQAARRARQAGFDAVQLHCAHGYLMSQFISPYTNHRTDAWGGSPQKRRRFALETYRKVRAAVGPRFPVLMKLNGADMIEGGLEVEESAALAQALEAEGLDAIEISCGISEVFLKIARVSILSATKEAYLLPLAEALRQRVHLPIILVGGMRSRATMERIIGEGLVDFVSMSRPLIREPDLPRRLRAGQAAATCCSCNACFQHSPGPLRCMHEEKFGKPPRKWRG